LFQDNPGRLVPEETLPSALAYVGLCCVQAGFPHFPVFWIFMEQGKIMEAEVPTVRVGATPTGLTAPTPKVFYRPDTLPVAQTTASKH